MALTTLTATKSVHMTSSDATTNQFGAGFVDVGEATGAVTIRRTLLQWDLSSLAGATISGVNFRFYDQGTDLTDNTRTMSCYRVLRAWGESTCTWNTTDGSTSWGTAGADNTTTDRESSSIGGLSMPNPPVAGYKDITLTASLVQEWVSGVMVNNGILLRMATETNDLHRFDSRSETNPPLLVIDYIPSGSMMMMMV
jgi:hypothetical protein